MNQTGPRNENHGPEKFGLRNVKSIKWNDDADALYDISLANGEGEATAQGALAVTTGKHTGRSATDKFIVRDSETESTVWWDNNAAMSEEHFDVLYEDFLAHAEGMNLYAQDLFGGADPAYPIDTRVYTEFAWHALFIRYFKSLLESDEGCD